MNNLTTLLLTIVLSIIALPTNANTIHSLDDGLVAYYPFDGNVLDASGNGHHGTVHG